MSDALDIKIRRRFAPTLEQAVLADFMAEGHAAHHLGMMCSLDQER